MLNSMTKENKEEPTMMEREWVAGDINCGNAGYVVQIEQRNVDPPGNPAKKQATDTVHQPSVRIFVAMG